MDRIATATMPHPVALRASSSTATSVIAAAIRSRVVGLADRLTSASFSETR